MLITFITVLAWLVVCGYVLLHGILLFDFCQLSPLQQQIVRYHIPAHYTVSFVLALAWLIAHYIG